MNEEGKKVAQKRLKLNTSEDIPELLLGVISDTQDRLQYFNDVGINYSTLRTRLCKMVAGSIPSQAAGLDQLDVLLITNYDVRRLSKDQLAAIREWVNRGGVLLLGTGARGERYFILCLWKTIWKQYLVTWERYILIWERGICFPKPAAPAFF